MRKMKDVLELEFGLDLSDWTRLEYARGVSDDGTVIVGRGIHTVDDVDVTEAWMATFDACTSANCDDKDPCTFDLCAAGCSINSNVLYGDVAGDGKCCGPDGLVDNSDLTAVLDAFAGIVTRPCTAHNMDIFPCGRIEEDAMCCEVVVGVDGAINVFDIFAVQDAINGSPACDCSVTLMPSPVCREPCTQMATGGSASYTTIGIKLSGGSRTISSGESVQVDVFASGLVDLRGYELSLFSSAVESTSRGMLNPTYLNIDESRADFVFKGLHNVHALDALKHRAVCALDSGGVSSNQERYLGTVTFTASPDASGQFTVSSLLSDGSEGILAGDANGDPITVNVTSDVLITVN